MCSVFTGLDGLVFVSGHESMNLEFFWKKRCTFDLEKKVDRHATATWLVQISPAFSPVHWTLRIQDKILLIIPCTLYGAETRYSKRFEFNGD